MKSNHPCKHLVMIAFLQALIFFTDCSKVEDEFEFLKGPYLQNVTTSTITIMWETKVPTIGRVVYGKSISYGLQAMESEPKTIHEITLVDLNIDTKYHYRVESNGVKSDDYTFTTAVDEKTPFSFAVLGDNKVGPYNFEKNMNLILKKNPHFVIHNGDLVDRGHIYQQWGKLFFRPAWKVMRSITLFPLLGNHEENADHWYHFFSLPNNERWYSFDFGNTHFILLDGYIIQKKYKDSEEFKEQIDWLVKDLEQNNAEWTIVNLHNPPFTSGGNYFRTHRIFIKNTLFPILEKRGVDLVTAGHDHNYERNRPIVSRKGNKPVTFITLGNGGTPLRFSRAREWTVHHERVFGFGLFHIDGAKLHFQAFNIHDEVIDEFTLEKDNPALMAEYMSNKIIFEDIEDPVEATKWYLQGDDLLDEEENYAEALKAFAKAYESDPTCTEALAGMAECYYELGQYDKAIEIAKKGVDELPQYPDCYEVLIDVYAAQKKYDLALDWCRKWLTIEPDNPDPNAEMAKIYGRMDDLDLAIQELENALAILPSDAELYIELGRLYDKKGDSKKALVAFKKGLEWLLGEEDEEDVAYARSKVKSVEK